MTTKYDIAISQNSVFRLVVTVVGGPANMAGYEGDMDIRQTKASTPALAKVLTSYITVDDINRQMVVEIPSSVTAQYGWDKPAVYDLYLVGAGGDRWRVLEGTVVLSKTVTREEA